jgi:hypothetical protein
MGGAWSHDPYRFKDNFYSGEEFESFQAYCTDQVQERLHKINTEVGKSEHRVTEAISCWNEIHSGSADCFGGQLMVELRQLTWAGSDPISGRDLHAMAVDADVAIYFGETVDAAQPVAGKLSFSSDGKTVSWRYPKPVTFFLGHGTRNALQAKLRVYVSEKRICGIFGGRRVAEFSVDLTPALFANMAPFDSSERQLPLEPPGCHFSVLSVADQHAGVVAGITVAMTCLKPEHNRPPPSINIAREQQRRRTTVSNIRDDIWQFPHHQALVDLLGILGEVDDTVQTIVQLYRDQYLLHEELVSVAMLAGVVDNSKFQDAENRELIVAAAERLVALRPHLVMKSSAATVDRVLERARRTAVDNILAIEDVASVPAEAGDVLLRCREILRITGVATKEIPDLVTKRSTEYVACIAAKVRKLARFIPSSNVLAARKSVLFELEQRDDKGLLVGKTKVLLDLADQVLFVAKTALEFAQQSRHKGVMAIACRRCDLLVSEILDPLRIAVTAVFSELAVAKQPDPLGDALGMMVLLYQSAFEVAQMCDAVPELQHLCQPLISMFDNYFPCWFSLCDAKVLVWIRNIVRQEPLVSMNPGKVLCNAAPGDARNLLEALYDVFAKVLAWSDLSSVPLYVISFVKLTALFTEVFVDQLVAKGKESIELEHWLVCISSLAQFLTIAKQFWQQKLLGEIIAEYDGEDRMTQAQCQIIFKESVEALLVDHIDRFAEFIGGGLSTWFASVLSHGSFSTLAEDLDAELSLIRSSTSEKKVVLRCAANGCFSAFSQYLLSMCDAPIVGERRGLPCQALDALESVLTKYTEVDRTELFDHAQRSRSLLQVAAQSSGQLISSVSDPKINEGEKQRMLTVLRCRKDRDAAKYIRNAC